MNISQPTRSEIDNALEKWRTLEKYVLQESSLKKLFMITYPKNNDVDDVLIKVCSLNDFYSTNIYSPFSVAKHIVSLNIDDRLSKGDLSVVNEIALVNMPGNKMRNFYSFATKYCSHHEPDVYPIYDYFTEKMLLFLNKFGKFSQYKKEDLKYFQRYKEMIIEFKGFYGLSDYSLKEIDRYLWIKGKDVFKKSSKNHVNSKSIWERKYKGAMTQELLSDVDAQLKELRDAWT